MIYDPFPFKRCSKCGLSKLRTPEYFCRDRRAKGGLCSACRECLKKDYQTDSDVRRARALDWQRRNPERANIRKRKWALEHPDRVTASRHGWNRRNPEKTAAATQRRMAKKKQLLATFSLADWRNALKYFNYCCAYCGNPPSFFDYYTVLQQEHHIPLSKGGGYTPDNILPACQNCNLAKHARDPKEWLIEHFGTRKAKVILKRIQDYFDNLEK